MSTYVHLSKFLCVHSQINWAFLSLQEVVPFSECQKKKAVWAARLFMKVGLHVCMGSRMGFMSHGYIARLASKLR